MRDKILDLTKSRPKTVSKEDHERLKLGATAEETLLRAENPNERALHREIEQHRNSTAGFISEVEWLNAPDGPRANRIFVAYSQKEKFICRT